MLRGKELKVANSKRCQDILRELDKSKETFNTEKEAYLFNLRNEKVEHYLDLVKGACIRSRAKWLEMGEKNTSYYFVLEKRNIKRNCLAALKIDNIIIKNPCQMNKYVYSFFKQIILLKL